MKAQTAQPAPFLEVYRDLFGEGWCAEYDRWIAWDMCPIAATAAALEAAGGVG